MQLRDYQYNCIRDTLLSLKEHDRTCLQLATGGGKTFVFSYLAKGWVKHNGKVVILVNRKELVEQTVQSLRDIGMNCIDTIVAGKKTINTSADVFVCMVETFANRLKKGKFDKSLASLIVVDECHRLEFIKVIDQFENAKILGVTATPIIYKKERFFRCQYCGETRDEVFNCGCCAEEAMEWTRDIPLANFYENIVCGVGISELIQQGFLCEDLCFVETPANIDRLKVSSANEDGYTKNSLKEVFEDKRTCFNVVKHYKKTCQGKKTLIFNSTTGSNLLLLEEFKKIGANVRMFDSVNSKAAERKDVVEWFRYNRDAVLLNVGVFTTGFDVRDIECIILNKATRSLSLFLQMVGRGGRITKKDEIYKDKFVVIDGGGNIDRFGKWSSKRDWKKLFFGDENSERPRKEDIMNVKQCEECGALIPKTAKVCEFCGATVEEQIIEKKKRENTELRALQPLPLPNGEKIYQYTKARGENINFAHKILISQIVDLFRYYQVEESTWNGDKREANRERIKKIIRAVYFPLMSHEDIRAGAGRKLDTLFLMTCDAINKFFEKKKGNFS